MGGALLFVAVCISSAWPQDADNAVNAYVDAGLGLNQNLGRSNPNYDADAGVDILHQRLFAEVEAGADTANASGLGNGYTIRTHALFYYRGKGHWNYGGGIHFSDFQSSAYKEHDLWPTGALLYDIRWLRLNSEYLFPGSNTNYHETGPLFDLRLRLTQGFYYRQRFALLHYTDEVQNPPEGHWGREVTFGILYVFRERQ